MFHLSFEYQDRLESCNPTEVTTPTGQNNYPFLAVIYSYMYVQRNQLTSSDADGLHDDGDTIRDLIVTQLGSHPYTDVGSPDIIGHCDIASCEHKLDDWMERKCHT